MKEECNKLEETIEMKYRTGESQMSTQRFNEQERSFFNIMTTRFENINGEED